MDIVKKSRDFAKMEYGKNDPKHQWAHIEAVRKQAMRIAKQLKGVDYELLELAILFHDIDYHSEQSYEENYKKHVENSAKAAEKFLIENNYPSGRIEKVKQIILDHSTPYRQKSGDSKTLEGRILYDADKSIFLTTQERYKKYFPLLYFEATRKLTKKPGE